MVGEINSDLKTNGISSGNSDYSNTIKIDASDLINSSTWINSDNCSINTNFHTMYSNVEYDVTEISNPEFFKNSNTYMTFEFIRRIFIARFKGEISTIRVSVSTPIDPNNIMKVCLKNGTEILISGNDSFIRILYDLNIQSINDPLNNPKELKETLEELIKTIKTKSVLD